MLKPRKFRVFASYDSGDYRRFEETNELHPLEVIGKLGYATRTVDLRGSLGSDILDPAKVRNEIGSDIAVVLIGQNYIREPFLIAELTALLAIERELGRRFVIPVYLEEINGALLEKLLNGNEIVRLPVDGYDHLTRLLEDITSSTTRLIFVSHTEVKLASALVALMKEALGFSNDAFRQTSAPSRAISPRRDINDVIRREVSEADLMVAVVTPSSLLSTMTMFEMGARWGSWKETLFLSAGNVDLHNKRPINAHNVLRCNSVVDLETFVKESGAILGVEPDTVSSYFERVEAVIKEAEAVGSS